MPKVPQLQPGWGGASRAPQLRAEALAEAIGHSEPRVWSGSNPRRRVTRIERIERLQPRGRGWHAAAGWGWGSGWEWNGGLWQDDPLKPQDGLILGLKGKPLLPFYPTQSTNIGEAPMTCQVLC